MFAEVLYGTQGWHADQSLLEDIPSGVRAAVIDNNDFVIDAVKAQFNVKVLHRGGNATLLVLRRDDDGEKVNGFPRL